MDIHAITKLANQLDYATSIDAGSNCKLLISEADAVLLMAEAAGVLHGLVEDLSNA